MTNTRVSPMAAVADEKPRPLRQLLGQAAIPTLWLPPCCALAYICG